MKNVTFTDDVSSYTDYQFKPQLRTVGPKYGKYLKQIQSVLSELDGNAAMKELKENGCLKLDIHLTNRLTVFDIGTVPTRTSHNNDL